MQPIDYLLKQRYYWNQDFMSFEGNMLKNTKYAKICLTNFYKFFSWNILTQFITENYAIMKARV